MNITTADLSTLAKHLVAERKRQGLTREGAASVCNVSTSFIRDAETDPQRCSIGKLMLLINGLGLTLTIDGWSSTDSESRPAQARSAGE